MLYDAGRLRITQPVPDSDGHATRVHAMRKSRTTGCYLGEHRFGHTKGPPSPPRSVTAFSSRPIVLVTHPPFSRFLCTIPLCFSLPTPLVSRPMPPCHLCLSTPLSAVAFSVSFQCTDRCSTSPRTDAPRTDLAPSSSSSTNIQQSRRSLVTQHHIAFINPDSILSEQTTKTATITTPYVRRDPFTHSFAGLRPTRPPLHSRCTR